MKETSRLRSALPQGQYRDRAPAAPKRFAILAVGFVSGVLPNVRGEKRPMGCASRPLGTLQAPDAAGGERSSSALLVPAHSALFGACLRWTLSALDHFHAATARAALGFSQAHLRFSPLQHALRPNRRRHADYVGGTSLPLPFCLDHCHSSDRFHDPERNHHRTFASSISHLL